MARWPRLFRVVCDFVGFDYLPYLLGKHFEDSAMDGPPPEGTPPELLSIAEPDASQEAQDLAMALLRGEEQRLETIERKAITLLGTTGVTTAFVVGFASLSLDGSKFGSGVPYLLTSLLFLFVVVSLIATILLSHRAVCVGKYWFRYPGIELVRYFAELPIIEARRKRTETTIECYQFNRVTVNSKADYLIGAQVWFRNAMVLLALLAFLLAGLAAIGSRVGGPKTGSPVPREPYMAAPASSMGTIWVPGASSIGMRLGSPFQSIGYQVSHLIDCRRDDSSRSSAVRA